MEWGGILPNVDTRARELIQMVLKCTIKPETKVLDVGCGDGSLTEMFARNCSVVGEDISPSLLEKANSKGISTVKINLDSENQPFPDGNFDIVVMGRVLEHLVNPDFVLKEINRVLKPNGKLFLSTPNLASWQNRVLLPLGIQPIMTSVSTEKVIGRRFKFLGEGNAAFGHVRVFTLGALKTILQMYGFALEDIRGSHFLERGETLWWLDKFFSFFPSVSTYLLVEARKRSSD